MPTEYLPTLDDGDVRVYHGDCLEVMAALDEASIDAIVTDPPYGLEFMGKEWDRISGQPGYNERGRITDRPDLDGSLSAYVGAGGKGVNSYQAGVPMQEWHQAWATEALRVLKPGGHLLAFGGTRTYHRLTCGLEDAGFEIRDTIAWIYGSGFPKSRNLDGAWQGWGTALKPAHEPVVVARKPLAGTVAANVLEYGTGALNIDGCRIGHVDDADLAASLAKNPGRDDTVTSDVYGAGRPQQSVNTAGRWPANVILDDAAGAALDAQTGESTSTGGSGSRSGLIDNDGIYGKFSGENVGASAGGFGDRGGASRFFYTAKADSAERRGSKHPTVKPLDLMRYLVRLFTPPGGLVLDPFAGSGTTLEAARAEGFRAIGIEREAEYLPDIARRLQQLSLLGGAS